MAACPLSAMCRLRRRSSSFPRFTPRGRRRSSTSRRTLWAARPSTRLFLTCWTLRSSGAGAAKPPAGARPSAQPQGSQGPNAEGAVSSASARSPTSRPALSSWLVGLWHETQVRRILASCSSNSRLTRANGGDVRALSPHQAAQRTGTEPAKQSHRLARHPCAPRVSCREGLDIVSKVLGSLRSL